MAVTKIPCGSQTINDLTRAVAISMLSSDVFKISSGDTYTANTTTQPAIMAISVIESCTISALSSGSVSLIDSPITIDVAPGYVFQIPGGAATTITLSAGTCFLIPIKNPVA